MSKANRSGAGDFSVFGKRSTPTTSINVIAGGARIKTEPGEEFQSCGNGRDGDKRKGNEVKPRAGPFKKFRLRQTELKFDKESPPPSRAVVHSSWIKMDKHKIIPKDDRFEIEYFSVFRNRTTVTSTANREARIKTEPGEEFHSSRNENEDDKRQDVEADKIKAKVDPFEKFRRDMQTEQKYVKETRPPSPVVVSRSLENSSNEVVVNLDQQQGRSPNMNRQTELPSNSEEEAPSQSSAYQRKHSNNSAKRNTEKKGGVNFLLKYIALKRSEGPSSCDNCRKRFTGNDDDGHKCRVTTSPRKFPCSTCGKAFIRQDHQIVHKLGVHDMVKFPCAKCHMRFTTQASMKRHVDTVHSRIRHRCFRCGWTCTRMEYLNAHWKKKHRFNR
ncbi:zinc finger protein with KRAB and SCAN domains 1 [Folsomia candida]|uniref:Myeloid zinc finger 1 n=1 Tax=Folsomia candida TaxID=158441 RepID=A0A226CZW0_FOLCA|nr:zinc finger protein with KRAB and SCAN domains 1 [Folsomia candida]OXA38852.1 Myeloid zinc finger 1 [Folsomia candida]